MNAPSPRTAEAVKSREGAGSTRGPDYNRKGQLLGEKGQRTRANIIAETIRMLPDRPLAEVTMANVSARLGLDKAAFYRYFKDIGEVLLAGLDRVAEEAEALLPFVDRDWPDAELHGRALEFVDSYYALLQRHSALIRARNSLADGGDVRFVESRSRTARPLFLAIRRMLETESAPPAGTSSASAMATLLITAVERAVTVTAHGRYVEAQPWSELRVGLAEMFESAILRRRPLGGAA
jgi:AcrR family transcriptional regulator